MFLVFSKSISRSASGISIRLGKMRFRTFLKIFILIFRANDNISMCSLLKYGKSVVKCLSDPLPPSKAGEPGLYLNKVRTISKFLTAIHHNMTDTWLAPNSKVRNSVVFLKCKKTQLCCLRLHLKHKRRVCAIINQHRSGCKEFAGWCVSYASCSIEVFSKS